MTIRYNQEIPTARFCGFLKLLFRWKGSIYKLVYFELRGLLHMSHNSQPVLSSCNGQCPEARVISRFWEQFQTIPWPNRMAIYVSTYLQTNDESGRLMRRTIMRYLCLAFVLTMSSISPPIKKRFPTLTHMTEAGFLLPNEQNALENISTASNKYFVPLIWATSVVARARKEGKIKSDLAVQRLVAEINDFRGNCGGLFSFDWVSIPLVYTQVVTLAVYIFSLSALLGRYQFDVRNGSDASTEKHFPFFTLLQFLFYMGWLKVAESLLCPFGEDDDDFDINLLVDRYLHESYMVVDEMFNKLPDLLKDQHWDQVDFEIPYTEAAAIHKKQIFLGSATGMEVPTEKQAFIPREVSLQELKSGSSLKVLSIHSMKPIKPPKKMRPKKAATGGEEISTSKDDLESIGSSGIIKVYDVPSAPNESTETKPKVEGATSGPAADATDEGVPAKSSSSLMAIIQDELKDLRAKK